jgi:hypothetical protein
MYAWDYVGGGWGEGPSEYPCWVVLDHEASGTGIAYSEYGFGPRRPWGLVFTADTDERRSMGMDSGWFPTFLEAFFESWASAELPVWQVFEATVGAALTEPMSSTAAWKRHEELQAAHPGSRFVVRRKAEL